MMNNDEFFGPNDDGFFEPNEKQPAPPPADPTHFEKMSYGKSVYKRVQRLRRKGRKRKIDVPYLGYALHKPEKPRIPFWVFAIISAVLFVGIVVGIVVFYGMLIISFTGFSDVGEAIKSFFDPATLTLSLGLSALPAIFLIIIYLMIAALLAIPILVAAYFFCFVRDAFYMAKCSREEFAKGNMIAKRALKLGIALIVITLIFIALMASLKVPSGKILVGVLYAGLVITLGGLLVMILIEKRKNEKWFETLSEVQKQNYLAHDGGLRKVKRRLRTERTFWDNLGR